MSDAATMRALIARVEAAEGWDSRIDEAIARALSWEQDENGEWHQVGVFFDDGILRRTAYAVKVPPWTRSLDAALTLVPEGWSWNVAVGETGRFPVAILGRSYPTNKTVHQEAATPAIALCAAAIRAWLATMEEAQDDR